MISFKSFPLKHVRCCQPNNRRCAVGTCARRTGFLQHVERSLVVVYSEWERVRAIFGCVDSVCIFIIINGTMAGPSMAKNPIYSIYILTANVLKVDYLYPF